jgi:hypothetical protein
MTDDEKKDEEAPRDENNVVMASQAAKWLSPKPGIEDLTAVRTGPGVSDYEYVDPASLFAIQRLMAIIQADGKVVKSHMKGFKPFVRRVAEAAWSYWPNGGYVARGPFTASTEAPAAGDQPHLFDEDGGVPVVEDEDEGEGESEESDEDEAYPEVVTDDDDELPEGLPGLGPIPDAG